MWRLRKIEENPAACFEALTEVCRLAISADGTLNIVLNGPTLTYEDLRLVMDRVEAPGVEPMLQQVVFDFGQVGEIQTSWTVVLAFLIRFATRASFACHVRNLSGQPANIFTLYRRSHDVMRLLATGTPKFRLPAHRRAG
ncbi:MAG TPA: hypothetical protein VJZ71_20250 [Phycisphaerae bacterium]|nr:hypothetical protein [Phycisphaerae bacterium]